MLNSILKLFRKSDPATSQEAAEHAQEFVKKHEQLILAALTPNAFPNAPYWDIFHNRYQDKIALTKSEISKKISKEWHCDIDSVQVCRRMKKLEEDGKVIRTELKRKNANGHSETVWRLA